MKKNIVMAFMVCVMAFAISGCSDNVQIAGCEEDTYTEDWEKTSLYCPSCGSNRDVWVFNHPYKNDRPCYFLSAHICVRCGASFKYSQEDAHVNGVPMRTEHNQNVIDTIKKHREDEVYKTCYKPKIGDKFILHSEDDRYVLDKDDGYECKVTRVDGLNVWYACSYFIGEKLIEAGSLEYDKDIAWEKNEI